MPAGPDSLGARLREQRRAQALAPTQLAQQARLTNDRISAIERDRIPSPGVGVERLAHTLGVSTHYLLNGATLSDDQFCAEIEQIQAELDSLLRRIRGVLRRAAVPRGDGRSSLRLRAELPPLAERRSREQFHQVADLLEPQYRARPRAEFPWRGLLS